MVEHPWEPAPRQTAVRSGRPPDRGASVSGPHAGWSRAGGVPARVEKAPEKKPKKKLPAGGAVVAVQCLACVVVLLLALLLRTVGGPAFEELCRRFNDSVMRNDLLAALATLWDGDPVDAVSDRIRAENEDVPAAEGDSASSGAEESDSVGEPTESGTGEPAASGGDAGSGADTDTAPAAGTAAAGQTAAAGRLIPPGTLAVTLRVNGIAAAPLPTGVLTSGYGYRLNPTGSGEQFHRGVDIAAPAGTPVTAMFFGRVAAVGENSSLGRYIRLEHGDGVQVLYAHCQEILAPEGAVVRAGETVALVGASGDATGAHLHIQVTENGTVFSPAAIVPLQRYGRQTDA